MNKQRSSFLPILIVAVALVAVAINFSYLQGGADSTSAPISVEKQDPGPRSPISPTQPGPGYLAPANVLSEPDGSRLRFNIDFGPWKNQSPSKKSGGAAVGREGDFWNTVGVPWDDDHTEAELRWADQSFSPITARLVNLGGGWGNGGGMGVKDPMLDDFNYPANNKGGNSQVILRNIPAGNYDFYLYGHGTSAVYYGDYTLTAGNVSHGRKATSNQMDAVTSTLWEEGKQFVVFRRVAVAPETQVDILIQPGGQVSDGGRVFTDAMICGLQMIPVE